MSSPSLGLFYSRYFNLFLYKRSIVLLTYESISEDTDYFAVFSMQSIAIIVYVCLSVCLLACLKNHMSKFYNIFCKCYLWP